ncbi:MAG: hypothetical protein GY845_28395 [Planctomycetes bacterium]|nr:hypothetical protein [Planctomycetota bacterium]
MVGKKITMSFLVLVCLTLVQNITFGAISEASEMEKQAYRQELVHIKALRKSLKSGPINDLKSFEKFADEIQIKWSRLNKEHYARLILEVCKPLSSGRFDDERQYSLARKYALLALVKPNQIPLETELELTGHVITFMCTPYAPKGADFAQRRKKDVEIRLHAWKRLIDSIDPKWNPNEVPLSPNVVAGEMGLPGSVEPQAIEDPILRAEYKRAIEANMQKSEKYREQNRLHKWLKRFPRNAEPYIIQAYSKPPFNSKELKQYLDKYIADKKTKDKMLDSVKKNIDKQTKDTPEDSKQKNR